MVPSRSIRNQAGENWAAKQSSTVLSKRPDLGTPMLQVACCRLFGCSACFSHCVKNTFNPHINIAGAVGIRLGRSFYQKCNSHTMSSCENGTPRPALNGTRSVHPKGFGCLTDGKTGVRRQPGEFLFPWVLSQNSRSPPTKLASLWFPFETHPNKKGVWPCNISTEVEISSNDPRQSNMSHRF